MMLRVVDLIEFEHGTNQDPAGVYWVPLPADWDQMDAQAQTDWANEAAGQAVPAGHRHVWEVVDAELPDYERENPPLPNPPEPEQ